MLYSHTVKGDIHEYELGAGQGFLICPGQINLYTADEQDPWHYVWIEFDGMRAAEYLWSAGLEQDQPIYRPRSAEDGALLRDHMVYFSQHAERSPLHLVGGTCPCFWTSLLNPPAAAGTRTERPVRTTISMRRWSTSSRIISGS